MILCSPYTVHKGGKNNLYGLAEVLGGLALVLWAVVVVGALAVKEEWR